MLYLIYGSYTVNSAVSNRRLAYFKGLSETDVLTEVWFLFPDKYNSVVQQRFKNIHFKYCWQKGYIRNRYFKYLSYISYLIQLYRCLKSGDVVLTSGMYDVISLLSRKKGIRLYVESTESPEVHQPSSKLYKSTLNGFLSLCKNLDGLFVITTALRDYYISKGVSADRVHIINMIVDEGRFNGVKKTPADRYIAYCGNGNNKKDRVDELIKIFNDISKTHPDVKLYLIGPTKQPYKDEKDNVELVKELGLEDSVVFTGEVNASEIPQLLVNATVLTLDRPDTIQNRCGFSTKLGEYLMSENPVVVTNTGDTGLFLKDHESALVVQPGDSETFKQQLIWVLEHPTESKLIGERGRKVAQESFNYLTEVKKLVFYMGVK